MSWRGLWLALWLALPLPAAADLARGEELHAQHCQGCHGTEVYTRERRIVNSYEELAERVRQCELSNDLTWFEEEINAVVDYLDATYYRFSQ